MDFTVTIHTGNDAFADDPVGELARLLRTIADRIEAGDDISHYRTILDSNGNDCGRFALKPAQS